MSRQLCWIRNDLRIHDNAALIQALARGPAVALYIACPGQWQRHHEAPVKLDFWRRNLELLQVELAKLRIPLVTARIEDYTAIPGFFESVLTQWQIQALHFNQEYPLNERQRDEAVSRVCRQHNVDVFAWQDQVLLSPEVISNQAGLPFRVFTPFSRKARELLQASDNFQPGPEKPVGNPHDLHLPQLPGQCELDEIDWPQAQDRWARQWPAGEEQACMRLDRFCLQGLDAYHKLRDQPALDATSRLSPYLAAGVLGIRECWRKSAACQDGEGLFTWQNELLWRDFYRHIMFHFPRVCQHQPWKQDTVRIPWRHDPKEFHRWCHGQTGFPIIDAAMRQLLELGWMHNRLRMIVAMFLSKHLLIDWRLGEKWFMQHLVDGDFAANNGGWQWSASTGTDAVPYFRIFNPVTQSQRFDPHGDFIRAFVPELATLDRRAIHQPGKLRPAAYPEPMIDLGFGRQRALSAFKNHRLE